MRDHRDPVNGTILPLFGLDFTPRRCAAATLAFQPGLLEPRKSRILDGEPCDAPAQPVA